MLAMTNPIDKTSSSLPVDQIELPAAQPSHVHRPAEVLDTIDSSSMTLSWNEKVRNFCIGVKELCLKCMRWLWDIFLYEILFFIFDRERETTLELEAEMKEFNVLYFELDRTKPESIELLKEKFTELREHLQNRVREELADLLANSDSDKTVDEVLNDDLEHEASVVYENGSAYKTFVFMDACIRTTHNPLRKQSND